MMMLVMELIFLVFIMLVVPVLALHSMKSRRKYMKVGNTASKMEYHRLNMVTALFVVGFSVMGTFMFYLMESSLYTLPIVHVALFALVVFMEYFNIQSLKHKELINLMNGKGHV